MRSFPRSLRQARKSNPVHVQPSLEQLESRLVPYALTGNAWPNPQLITISFEPDNTVISGNTGSNLFAAFNAKFGSPAVWENIILKAAQTWAAQTNINFAIVSDNGASIGSGANQQGDPGFGDIRIGGYSMGASSLTLAQAYMPPPANNQSAAGDMMFNTDKGFNIGSTYDLFTVAVHEFGHALGLDHNPSSSAAVMYAYYLGTKSSLTTDDINGIRAIYSGGQARANDQFGGNNSTITTAANLNSLLGTLGLTAQSTNLNLSKVGTAEYFTVNAPLLTSGNFAINVKSAGLSLLSPALTVYAADRTTVLGTASGAGQYGANLTVNLSGVTAGQQFYIKVAGADSTVFSTGAYALTLNFGTGALPAVALPITTLANGNPLQGGGGIATEVYTEMATNSSQYTAATLTTTGGNAVATDSNGNYVVTWASYNQDGCGWGIYARRYNAQGLALGSEFRVNSTTFQDQTNPAIAMDGNGDFVITWSSNWQDGFGQGIYGQRFNAAGVAQGSEFRINSYTFNDQNYSAVAMDPNGNFVVSWASYGEDGSGWGVYAQRFSANGAAAGGEFRVNSTTVGDQTMPTITVDAYGNFTIAWQSYGQDGGGWGIYAKRFYSNGIAFTGDIQVNSTTAHDQESPSIASDALGDFTVTWSSYEQDGSDLGVYARRYDLLGQPVSSEFRVNTSTLGAQENSHVAEDAFGNSIITWQSFGQDGGGWGIYAQQYSFLGYGLGTEYLVNTSTALDQTHPSVALNANGNAQIVWNGNVLGGQNVYAQIYRLNSDSLDQLQVDPRFLQVEATVKFDPGSGTIATTQHDAVAANGGLDSDASFVVHSPTTLSLDTAPISEPEQLTPPSLHPSLALAAVGHDRHEVARSTSRNSALELQDLVFADDWFAATTD